jgi:hypothetical protein
MPLPTARIQFATRADHITDKSPIICLALRKTIGNEAQHFVRKNLSDETL